MKKIIVVFALIVIIIILVISVTLAENNKNINIIKNYNKEYEEYLQKTVFGTDVTTLINKATNENIKNDIEKDEKGYFIENTINSIKIEINLLYDGKLTPYSMEDITRVRNWRLCSKF